MAASEAASEEATASQGSSSGHVVRAVYVNTSNEPHDDVEAEHMYCEAATRAQEKGDLAVLADLHFNVGNVRQRLGARQTTEEGAFVSAGGVRLGGDAETAFRSCLEVAPGHADARNNLGVLLMRRGDLKGAIDVLRVDEMTAKLATNLGVALEHAGNRDEARVAYQLAMDLSGRGDDQPLTNMGNLLLAEHAEETDLEKVKKAVLLQREALELKPEDGTIHYNLAIALEELGDNSEEAISEYRRCLEFIPTMSNAHNNLGLALEEEEPCPFDEIEAHFQAALTIDDGDYDARCNLGAIRRRRGDEEGAFEAFSEAAVKDPNQPEAFLAIAEIEASRGGLDAALVAAKSAVWTARPDSDEKEKAGELLKTLLTLKIELAQEETLKKTPMNSD